VFRPATGGLGLYDFLRHDEFHRVTAPHLSRKPLVLHRRLQPAVAPFGQVHGKTGQGFWNRPTTFWSQAALRPRAAFGSRSAGSWSGILAFHQFRRQTLLAPFDEWGNRGAAVWVLPAEPADSSATLIGHEGYGFFPGKGAEENV